MVSSSVALDAAMYVHAFYTLILLLSGVVGWFVFRAKLVGYVFMQVLIAILFSLFYGIIFEFATL